MRNFLEKIGASEHLKQSLWDGQMKAHIEKDTDKIRVTFNNVTHLKPAYCIELYEKIKKSLKIQMNKEVSFIKIDELEHKNDLLFSYDNIREFLRWINPKIDLSHICTEINDQGELQMYIAREEVYNEVFSIENELIQYLNNFSISNRNLNIKLDPSFFSEQKLNKIIEETTTKTFVPNNTPSILDEKVRENFTPIDFQDTSKKQQRVYFEGIIFNKEDSEAKTGTKIYNITLVNGDNAVKVTVFDKHGKMPLLNTGEAIRVYGIYEFDEFAKGHILKAFTNQGSAPQSSIQKLSIETIENIEKDETDYVRNEFHVHTKMSTLDGVSTVKEYIKYAEAYGLGSITITDHNTTQAFPEAYAASRGTDVKVNYGVELDVYDDLNTKIVLNEREQDLLDAEYVLFDLETTSVTAWTGEIIEFGAVKYKNNTIIDRKQMFIKPDGEISEFTTSLTSIKNSDVANAPKIDEAIHEIKEWMGDAILVAHNASFDYNFLNKAYIDAGFGPLKNPVIDTMKISWIVHPTSRAHRLGVLAKNEIVRYDETAAHRADYDAEILAKIWERLIHKLHQKDIRTLTDLNNVPLEDIKNYIFTKHITLVSKNQEGLRDLNEIVSLANIDYFNARKKSAMIPLSFFINKENRLLKNIMVGSSCSKGFLFEGILDNDWPMVEFVIQMYDYLEIFPPTSYKNLILNEALTYNQLKKVMKKIKELGDKYNIPVIVSSNAHYSNKKEKEFRNILISAKRVGGGVHPLNNYKNPTIEKPDNHLRSTTEIFNEFKGWFSEEEIIEMTITNPAKLQSMIGEQKPIKDDLYSPKIPKAEEKLRQSINDTLNDLYGANPDSEITERVKRELEPIIEHGFAIIYYLSAIAVKKSNEDGFLVGSRGSVGSSIAATFSGITEVNPLRPHYRCPECKHHEFNNDVDCGFDLPNKKCPVCQSNMIGDGHKIPFETFLGFNADKVPDIDLNFSRDNQSDIHLYMKEVLGEDNVFRAGTISTAAFKTAMGYVKNYEELNGKNYNQATVEYLASKIEGAKRTTGQHPGGLIVIPNDMSVYDFTPINYPGDDANADWKTTHFDFHSIHDNLLKLDLLGHLDPSSVRMLELLTGVDPKTIPMNDKEVISLFESNNALNYLNDYTGEKLGILGLPEFGTRFVRRLVSEAKPKSFADLVRISGLSHGTDVWSGNAQTLINGGVATLSEVISVRDDIMTYLIEKGVESSTSFDIMESVRKGKGLTPEWEHSMRENNVPDWYIESCKAIKYMFPKAHATAYVMMAFRIAWYKINYPLEYYATFFSKRDVEMDLGVILKGIDEMKKHYQDLKAIAFKEKTKKDNDLIETYQIIFEMYSRGFEFENVNIHKSRSENFEINRETGNLIPPFSILDSVGELVAKGATEKRRQRPYESVADFKNRSGLPKKVFDNMEALGIFKDEESKKTTTQQLELFG